MPDPVAGFLSEVYAAGMCTEALKLAQALHEIDIEGDYNPHASLCWEGVRFVLARRDKSLGQRMEALQKVLTNRGTIRLPQDLGWT
jgi:hypothetical protein